MSEQTITIHGRDVHQGVLEQGADSGARRPGGGICGQNPPRDTQPDKQMTLTFFVFKDHETALRYVKVLTSSSDAFN